MKKIILNFILIITTVISFCGFIGGTTVFAACSLTGWANRIQINIDHTKINSNLTNFPVIIHLGPSSGINTANVTSLFDVIGSNSKKIAITSSDGISQCFVEIEK
jgi:hypothetical protein